jgi:hypothetical protein
MSGDRPLAWAEIIRNIDRYRPAAKVMVVEPGCATTLGGNKLRTKNTNVCTFHGVHRIPWDACADYRADERIDAAFFC